MRYLIALTLFPSAVLGEPVPLGSGEIRTLLTNNTILGYWVDHDYRQYFSDGGTTYYAPKTVRTSRGRWRVNDVTQEYESEWRESGHWEGYGIAIEGETYFWISDGLPPQPFEVLEGDQLVWPLEQE